MVKQVINTFGVKLVDFAYMREIEVEIEWFCKLVELPYGTIELI